MSGQRRPTPHPVGASAPWGLWAPRLCKPPCPLTMGGALRAHDPTHHPMVVISNSAPGNEVFQIIHDLSGNCNIDSKEFY